MQTIGTGRYELEAEIATGAVGTVWRARDTGTGERVAVKLLRPDAVDQPALVESFLREAAILSDLSHPCVVRARELVPVGSGYALVLDLVNGLDLRRRLRCDGPLPAAVAVDVVAQVADALAYVHGHGIVHGDVKPGNILVPVDGSAVQLTDFGVARRVADAGQDRATHATPEYVAPEVIGGAPPRASTDVYALGIVLYELLCGRSPFRGGAASEVLYRHISCVPVAPAGFPEALWPVVLDCLAPDPDERPAAGTLAARLRTLQPDLAGLAPLASAANVVTWWPREGQQTPAVPAPPIPVPAPVPARRAGRRPRLLAGVGAAALLVLLAGLGVTLLLQGGTNGPVTRPVAVVSPQSSPATAPSSPVVSAPAPSNPAASASTPVNSSPADRPTKRSDHTDTGGTQPPILPIVPGMGDPMPGYPTG